MIKSEKITGFKHHLLPSFSRNWIVVITLYALLHFLAASNQILYFYSAGDNATYYMLAQSLVQGHGYTDIYADPPTPHVKFPFIFPLMIAFMLKVFGENILLIKVMIALCAVVMILFTALLWQKRDGSFFSIVTTILVTTMPLTLSLSSWIMSEIPFIAFTCISLYCAEYAFNDGSLKHIAISISLFFMLCACLTRAAGIVIGPALVLATLLNRPLRKGLKHKLIVAGIIFLLYISAAATWYYYRPPQVQAREKSYVQEFFKSAALIDRHKHVEVNKWVDLFQRTVRNAEFYSGEFGNALWPFPSAFSEPILTKFGVFIFAIFLLGFVVIFLKKQGAPEFFTLFYAAVLLLWSGQDHRFLVPLYPFLVYYLFKGFEFLLRYILFWLQPPKRNTLVRGGIIFIALLILTSNFSTDLKTYQKVNAVRRLDAYSVNPWFYIAPLDDDHAHLLQVVTAFLPLVKSGDKVLSRKEPLVALILKVVVTDYPPNITPSDFFDYLTKNNIKFLIVDEFNNRTRKGVFSSLLEYPDSFTFVMRVEKTMIYQFTPTQRD
ncbi:ArnT family glycosyltransferase [candidate division CSSED10-310 bacterium]|uniref:ArnT family glycosyltransferase n=1 Tax=candidate division CSSED10-310 bacterium TaxID=2855610 RepID=A0ABV6Z630_UNCC1